MGQPKLEGVVPSRFHRERLVVRHIPAANPGGRSGACGRLESCVAGELDVLGAPNSIRTRPGRLKREGVISGESVHLDLRQERRIWVFAGDVQTCDVLWGG